MTKLLVVNNKRAAECTNTACSKACKHNNEVDPSHTSKNLKNLVPVAGTFCGVIQKQLITSQCPLPKGSCFWKHRISGQCKYENNPNLGVHELANRVGVPVPSEEKAIKLKDKILQEVRKAIHS